MKETVCFLIPIGSGISTEMPIADVIEQWIEERKHLEAEDSIILSDLKDVEQWVNFQEMCEIDFEKFHIRFAEKKEVLIAEIVHLMNGIGGSLTLADFGGGESYPVVWSGEVLVSVIKWSWNDCEVEYYDCVNEVEMGSEGAIEYDELPEYTLEDILKLTERYVKEHGPAND